MVENVWDEIWNKQVSRGLLLFQPKDDPRWVVDRDWFKEVKAEGDRLNEQLEVVKKFVEKGPSLNVKTLEDCQQAVDDWLGKLMNILEAEA